MNWQKNAFSYILWLFYTAAVGVGVLGVAVSICYVSNYPLEYGFAIAAGYLVVAGLFVLGIRKLWKRVSFSAQFEGSMTVRVIESLIVIALLAVGLYLRLDALTGITDSVNGMVYFDAAMVAADKSIPQVVHGASYLYLYLLHCILILFGNKLVAAVGFQIFLQMLAVILFYVSVRKLAGSWAGILTTALVMLSPYMIGEALTLSPAFLFLAIYALGLLPIGGCIKKNAGSPVWYVLAGVLAGVVAYLDVFGVTLLLFFAGVFTLEREPQETLWNSRIVTFLFAVLGGLVGFFGAIAVDAFASGKDFVNVLCAWGEIILPQDFDLMVTAQTNGSFVDAAVLMVMLALGIFSFWCRKRYERQGIWIVVAATLIALQGFQMMLQNTGSYAYLYIFLAVLAGTSVEAILLVDESKEVKEFVTADTSTEEDQPAGKEEKVISEEVDSKNQEQEPPKVQFLENPLPLPKKHEPKVLDYKLNDVKADYDYEIDADDDFDIQ